jgi:hypothetical protein
MGTGACGIDLSTDARTAYTQSRVDFRPGIVFSLKNRRFDHWTPQYLRYRLQAAIRAALRPEEPSLTPQAVRELDRRLTRDMVGIEWAAGTPTRFFARRTRHLTSFETDTSYYQWVAGTLRTEGLDNVDYRLIPHDFEGEDDEQRCIEILSSWPRINSPTSRSTTLSSIPLHEGASRGGSQRRSSLAAF